MVLNGDLMTRIWPIQLNHSELMNRQGQIDYDTTILLAEALPSQIFSKYAGGRSTRGEAFAYTIYIEHGESRRKFTSNYRNRLLTTFEVCKTFHMAREALALHYQTLAIVHSES